MQIPSIGQRESPETPSKRSEIPPSETLAVWPGVNTSSRENGVGAVGVDPEHAVTARRHNNAETTFILPIFANAGLIGTRFQFPAASFSSRL